MKTRIGNYYLTADEHQFKLTEISIIKEGEKKGEESEKNPRYFPRLDQVADALYRIELSKSDSETLHDVLKCVYATRRLIKTAGWTKEDFK